MGMGMYGGMDPNAYAMYAAAAAAGDQNAGAYMAAAAAQAQARPLPVRQNPFARRAPFLEEDFLFRRFSPPTTSRSRFRPTSTPFNSD